MGASHCAWLATRRAPVAWLAGLFIALHPGLIVYSTMKLHALVVDTLCFLLVAWASLRYADRPTVRRALTIGLMTGLCVLTRPTVVVLLPLIAWWVWRTSPLTPIGRLNRVGVG